MISILLEKIKGIDHQVFDFIHHTLKNPFLDTWMPFITNFDNWTWLFITGLAALFIFGGKKGRLVCAVIIITLLFADNFNSYILKPFFGRLRPNAILDATSPSFSFPSNHAVNIFALAAILSWYYRKLFPIWLTIACIVGFSRIYVGVHYPLDIVGGLFVGVTCALVIIWLVEKITNKFFCSSAASKS